MGDAETLELVREGAVAFSRPLARALLRDRRLSWGARGLFAFLWDCPRGWRPSAAHLSTMGPDGITAVRARLRELETVAALRYDAIRNPDGTLAGKRWVIRAPELWAEEAPLTIRETAPERKTTEKQVFRFSEKPKISKTPAKDPQKKKEPPPPPVCTPAPKSEFGAPAQELGVVEAGLEDPPVLNEGAAAPSPAIDASLTQRLEEADLKNLEDAYRAEGHRLGKIDPSAWARGAIRRIRRDGPTPEDHGLLAAWRQRQITVATLTDQRRNIPPLDPDAIARGLALVPEGIRARVRPPP